MKKKCILVILGMMLLLTSCGTVAEKIASVSNNGEMNEKKRDVEKYNVYIEFLNFQNGWLNSVAQTYFDVFGVEETVAEGADYSEFGFDAAGDENSLYSLYKDKSAEPREYAEKEPDYGEIDEKMLLLCDKLDTFIELYFKEVNQYYVNKEFEQDDMAKGQELHKKMIEAYNELAEAIEVVTGALSDKTIALEEEELPRLKEEGYLIRYYSLSILKTGREISEMFRELEEAGTDFLEADLDRYQKLYDEFVNNVQQLEQVYKDSEQLEKEGYQAINVSFLGQLIDTCRMMETAATDTLNMIKAGTTEIENELSGKVTTGGRNYPIGRFDQRLEMLIGQYNQSIQ